MSKKNSESTLLVAVDFSSFSREAVLFAARLADDLDAAIIILHVIHDPAEAPGFYAKKKKKKKYLQNIEDSAADMMEEFVQDLQNENPKLNNLSKAETLLVIGTPVKRIIEVAKKKKARMIVLGSHGRTGFTHFLVGSKVNKVVQLSTIPVTVVKSIPKNELTEKG
jgi:nucleotide-binding universal stress UspA family protein